MPLRTLLILVSSLVFLVSIGLFPIEASPYKHGAGGKISTGSLDNTTATADEVPSLNFLSVLDKKGKSGVRHFFEQLIYAPCTGICLSEQDLSLRGITVDGHMPPPSTTGETVRLTFNMDSLKESYHIAIGTVSLSKSMITFYVQGYRLIFKPIPLGCDINMYPGNIFIECIKVVSP